jgi:TolB-like protein/Flp pilus assembly protein TadD
MLRDTARTVLRIIDREIMTERFSQTIDGEDSGDRPTVFFSYSRTDQAEALPIIKAIEAAGYRVWWDGMLEGGTEFLAQTEAALENAKAVVVLWSRNAVGSHWVRDEATSGRERDRLIPLTLDGTMPPLGFRQLQVIDMRKWYNKPATQDELMRGLAKLHDRDFEATDTAERFGTGAVDTPSVSRRGLLFVGGAGAVAALGGAGFLLSRHNWPSSSLGRSIAVLPFKNVADDGALEYMVGGLASAVRDGLSITPLLDVTAQSSSEEAASKMGDPTVVAKSLNVDHILEGRYEEVGDRKQFVVSLVSGRTGFVLWNKTLPYWTSRILVLRDEIIQNVVRIMTNSKAQPQGGLTENPEAYHEYMRARESLRLAATPETIDTATQRFRRATELDPGFAVAHSALAEMLLTQGAISGDKGTSLRLIEAAVKSAQAGVDVAPNSAATHMTYGIILASGRADYKGAKPYFDRAERLGINQPNDINRFAIYLAGVGRSVDAISAARRGLARDPLNPSVMEMVAYTYYASGQFERAITLYQDVLRSDPDRLTVRSWLGLSMIYAGDPAGGLAICADEKNLMEAYSCQAIGKARMNDRVAADRSFAALIDRFGDAAAYQQAQILAQMGEPDRAMETLLKAEQLQDTGLSLTLIDPALRPLKGREDFNALLVRLGLSD